MRGANNVDGYNFHNLIITNTGTLTGDCFRFTMTDGLTHSNGVTITNCYCSGGQFGIRCYVETNLNTRFNNIKIQGNVFSGHSNGGVVTGLGGATSSSLCFSNVDVNGNLIENCTGSASFIGFGIILQSCGPAVNTCYARYNQVYNIGASSVNQGSGGPYCIECYYSSGVIIEGNVCNTCYEAGGQDGTGVDIDLNNLNCQLVGNVCVNCQGAGCIVYSSPQGGKHVIAFNLIVNCATTIGAGIDLPDNTDPIDIYNNTVIQQTGSQAALSVASVPTSAHVS